MNKTVLMKYMLLRKISTTELGKHLNLRNPEEFMYQGYDFTVGEACAISEFLNAPLTELLNQWNVLHW